jgi:HAD superfamily hydrolase (TIGR01509 family)
VKLRHIIFDCDGVLVDSEPISMRADVSLLQRYGIEISEAEAHNRFVGTTFQAMLDMMTAQHGVVFPEGLHEVKNRMVEDMYRRELQIVDGVLDVLQALKSKGLTLSIASNSPRDRVKLAVDLAGIAGYFESMTTYQDVKHGKPAPDVFLKAAERAGMAPVQCLVVEDSLTGVTASVAAKIRTIGFVGTHAHPQLHADALKSHGAAVTIGTMAELLHHL